MGRIRVKPREAVAFFVLGGTHEVYPRETERHRMFLKGVICVRHHGSPLSESRAPVLLRFDLLEISRIRETTSERRDAFFYQVAHAVRIGFFVQHEDTHCKPREAGVVRILNRPCAFWRVLARFSKGHALQAERSRRCP